MRCDLIDDKGELIDTPIDQEVEFRFNLMLDSLEDWKQSINKHEHERYSLSGQSATERVLFVFVVVFSTPFLLFGIY